MKILTVVSGLDFNNYTRKATIKAIHSFEPELEILLYNSILNFAKKKQKDDSIKFTNYHFWVVERFRKVRLFVYAEYFIRFLRWRWFFSKFKVIFFIDPNQYYLLPYLKKEQKLVYLLRDPSILLDLTSYSKEKKILKRADLVLAVSKSLCDYYFDKYYGFRPRKIELWPNTVDLSLWDYNKLRSFRQKQNRPLIGLAGNIDYVIDLELLGYIAENLPEFDLAIAGKIDKDSIDKDIWADLISRSNVKYLGFIPFDKFPEVVINWDVGIVAARNDNEWARYLNNNKQYQYVALGKPFVTYQLNADYKIFEDLVFIASDKDDFILKIREAYKKAYEAGTVQRGINIALKQSSEKRAADFLRYIEGLS